MKRIISVIDDVRSEISEIGLNLTKIKESIYYVSSRPKTCCDQNKIHNGWNKVSNQILNKYERR